METPGVEPGVRVPNMIGHYKSLAFIDLHVKVRVSSVPSDSILYC